MIMIFYCMQHILLEHDDIISCKYFVTFLMISSDYDKILQVLKFCGKNYLPFMIFCTEKSLKNCFGAERF